MKRFSPVVAGLAVVCASLLASCADTANQKDARGPTSRYSTQPVEAIVKVRVETEQPAKVMLPLGVTVEANSTTRPTTLPVDVKVEASAPKEVVLPVTIKTDASAVNPVTIPVKTSVEKPETMIIPVQVKRVEPATTEGVTVLPVTIKPTADDTSVELRLIPSVDPPKGVDVPVTIKPDAPKDTSVTLQLVPSVEPPKTVVVPIRIEAKSETPRPTFGFSIILIWGAAGGCIKAFIDLVKIAVLPAELTRDQENLWKLIRQSGGSVMTYIVISLVISVLYGVIAATLMPFLLYILRGDASDKVLYSACFGAGFVGSKLLDNFDRIMVRDFLGKKDDEVNRQTVRPPNSP